MNFFANKFRIKLKEQYLSMANQNFEKCSSNSHETISEIMSISVIIHTDI